MGLVAGSSVGTSSSRPAGSHRPHGSPRPWGLLVPAPICPYPCPMPRKCSICSDTAKNQWVARRHLEGYSASKMEEMRRDMGQPIKRETISKHLKVCVGAEGAKPDEVKAVAETVQASVGNIGSDNTEDVAVLVQKEVVRKLKAGEGRVTVQHGLQAQQLLDRRAERAKDRELAITLARLLHSGGPSPEAIRARPVDAIEGEVVEVE